MSLVKIILVGLIAINSATSAEQQAWKDIRYMRGLVEFQIPDNWIAQYDEWDRGTYFEDSDDSGILRIDVSTLNSKALLDQNSTVDLLIALDEDSTGEFSALPNGNALHSYTQQVAEGEYELLIYWWVVAKVIDPHHLRLANFSYTILASMQEESGTKAVLSALRDKLSQSRIGREIEAAPAAP